MKRMVIDWLYSPVQAHVAVKNDNKHINTPLLMECSVRWQDGIVSNQTSAHGGFICVSRVYNP